MAIGTGLAIAAGASALGGLIKAKTQSSAAKNAAATQVAATQKASDYMTQGMGQLGQLYSPYINAGAGAQNTLSRLTTPGPGAKFASPGAPNNTPMPQGYNGPAYGMPQQPQYGGQMQQPMGMPYGGTFAQMMPQQQQMPQQPMRMPMMPPQQMPQGRPQY